MSRYTLPKDSVAPVVTPLPQLCSVCDSEMIEVRLGCVALRLPEVSWGKSPSENGSR